jgi:hypothetical protein
MQRTETGNFAIVLSGEITMMLDDEDVHLAAGDVVVQRSALAQKNAAATKAATEIPNFLISIVCLSQSFLLLTAAYVDLHGSHSYPKWALDASCHKAVVH